MTWNYLFSIILKIAWSLFWNDFPIFTHPFPSKRRIYKCLFNVCLHDIVHLMCTLQVSRYCLLALQIRGSVPLNTSNVNIISQTLSQQCLTVLNSWPDSDSYCCDVPYWMRCRYIIMSPLYRGGDILLYISPLICSSDQFCVCAFSPSIMQAVKHETLTKWPTVYDAEPTLAQCWVTVSCLTPRWMWAGVTDGGPTLTQPFFFYLNRPKVWRTNKRRQPDILAP